MKITITSETTGPEICNLVASQLAASQYKIDAKGVDIVVEVQNKEGKWVPFEAAKVRFVYSK